jgi:hypothetical protein
MCFSNKVTAFLLPSLIFALISCQPIKISGSSDALPEYSASEISQLIGENCTGCHASENLHSQWPSYSDVDWIKSGYVVAGSPELSLMYTSLQQNSGLMPKDRPAISAADLISLKSWIEDLEVKIATPELRFSRAKAIIQQKCISCHGTGSLNGDFAALESQELFVTNKWVIAGDHKKSPIFLRLQNNGLVQSEYPAFQQNMPQEAALNPEEIQTFQIWIQLLSQ